MSTNQDWPPAQILIELATLRTAKEDLSIRPKSYRKISLAALSARCDATIAGRVLARLGCALVQAIGSSDQRRFCRAKR